MDLPKSVPRARSLCFCLIRASRLLRVGDAPPPSACLGEYLSGEVLNKRCSSIGLSKACGENTLRIHIDKPSDRYKPRNHWTQIDHKTDYELEPAPEPVEVLDPIRCPRVSVFPSTIVQPSFLDDVPIMTFEREPGKATFVHNASKQLSLFE